MVMRKLSTCSNSDAMASEQRAGKPEKEGHDSLDNFIRQAIGKDSLQSFSTASEYRKQWIQSFQALDQQGTNKLSKGPKVDCTDGKDWQLEYCNGVSSFPPEMNGIKEPAHSLRGSGISVKGTKNSSENMQTLKIPEAVVAFAQAAAKTNDLHGWPLLSPTQMQKCDKCSREFCSPINYRRHIRVHRRALNIDKDSTKNRDFLGAFWDKLSLDEAREIVSFKDVSLEDVAGSSIIYALSSFIRKLGFSSLPHAYVKAGAALLDVVQASPPRFPISSQEFFSILDDASEKTFLCAGTAISLQKFVFDGEAGKIGLEMKNLVACTSFLVEQKLVKAWIADKEAEALRCQKLLVEEVEADQKRRAEHLERKRLKKLRQKEQRSKEQIDGYKAEIKEGSYAAIGVSADMCNLPFESDLNSADASSNSMPLLLEHVRCLDAVAEEGVKCHLKPGDTDVDTTCSNTELVNSQNVDTRDQMQQRESQRKLTGARRSLPKLFRNTLNGFCSGDVPILKSIVVQKHNYRDQRAASLANGHKVWTRKTKLGVEEECSNVRVLIESGDQPGQSSCSEVLIGSICVMLGDHGSAHHDDVLVDALDRCDAYHQKPRRNSAQEKPVKLNASQNGGAERSTVKLWRPVSRHEIGGSIVVQGDKSEDRVYEISGSAVDLSSESCVVCSSSGDGNSSGCKDSVTAEAGEDSTDMQIFLRCVETAKAFLEQRWKGALAEGLVLSSQTELPDCLENLDGKGVVAALSPSDSHISSVLGDTGNPLAGVGPVQPIAAAGGSSTPKFRPKAEKGSRLKYVPKQRMNS